jgi:hypothetical protein
MMIRRQRRARKGVALKIHPSELMVSWVYDEKSTMGTHFLFGTLLLTAGEDDDLEHPTQE